MDVDKEVEQLTQDIEYTSMQISKAQKGFSLRGSSWWNNKCDLAAARACEA
jgi:hypothetical protein